IGMMAALHQQAGTAEREGLLDLLVDDRLRQQVALAAITGAAVERAEVAVGDADVRVVEVAVDDEGDAVRVDPAGAGLVRRAAGGEEVTGLEQRDGIGVGDPLACERPVEDLGRGHEIVAPAVTKRSLGTSSSSPTSRASSRNVYSPARSRGPKRYR